MFNSLPSNCIYPETWNLSDSPDWHRQVQVMDVFIFCTKEDTIFNSIGWSTDINVLVPTVSISGHWLGSILTQVFTVKPCLTATSVIWAPHYYGYFFWPPCKNRHTFSCKKTLVSTATPLMWPNFFGPLVTVLTGFHCSRQQMHVISPQNWKTILYNFLCLALPNTPKVSSWSLGNAYQSKYDIQVLDIPIFMTLLSNY